ncbi:hypothetical protein PVNG_06363 [Plasmodium vivax North Korean]|uniref:Uncharacterized protein n=1 Tax=Plasmodium vivax North Korean TaxID=1035514 RepID=A0A0J9TJZ9_PLAVI|nr:hypothetical protein PVNG_06363 [Plasmodium vivax North Korean]
MRMFYNLYISYYGSLHKYEYENEDEDEDEGEGEDESEYSCTNFFKKFKVNYDKCLRRCYIEELNELIWLQYNIPFQYEVETKKYYMMNILQQFFQYCDENRKNEKLSSFMEEFIEQYYNKKKGEYKDIFNECENNDEEKTHCQLYKECEKKFSNDLSTIKTNTDKYITQQKNYINSLSALELWIFKAKSMFQDFASMSRISPTIMSTMIAIVVCLFFLYKVLKKLFKKYLLK